ncbi:MAG: DUF1800 domain-containing protein [Fimbriimonadaceae bacterium]|jgi:uncharacterized protein (DUF1800 family)|nr:DUF1800 domain-containing protein [Fimbriimonadaceae bacterium]
MGLTEEQRKSHLLRRFGLGAGKTELDSYAGLSSAALLDRLLDDKTDEAFPITPWQFAAYEDGTFQLEPQLLSGWWALRMMLTKKPLHQRMALFWHNHFAVNAEKIFDFAVVNEYLTCIDQHGLGNFRNLLTGISKGSAMIFYLDTHLSDKSAPNENFAREVLELFCLGPGHYSEQDIREAARSCTGWSLHYEGIGTERPFDELRQSMANQRRSVFSYCFVPDKHDVGPKTILGRTGAWNGDDFLNILMDHPQMPRFITEKLANWFMAYPPSKDLKERLVQVFTASNFEIKPVLRTIAESDEFWSEREIKAKPKSPVDFTVTLFRQLGVGGFLSGLHPADSGWKAPLNPVLKGVGGGISYLMLEQGLFLLYPPNVGGWPWGKAWITTANSVQRWRHSEMIFRGDDPNRPIAVLIGQRILNERKAKSPADVARAFCSIFDAQLTDKQIAILEETVVKHGGVQALSDKDQASALLVAMGNVLFALPEFQLY